MKIDKISLKNRFIFAPIAGYSIGAYRRLMAKFNAGLTVTEMVSTKGLLYENEKTRNLLKTYEEEKIKCVQLFGNNPDDFYKCGKLKEIQAFDIIDVNMGCPVKKIVKNGEGSFLMTDFKKAMDIVVALKESKKAVTVKTRLGYKHKDEILSFAEKMQEAGADLLTIHCRTSSQMYSGKADYSNIAILKKNLSIPIAINGDIIDSQSFLNAKHTGADFFMIARGALYNPLIFFQLEMGDTLPSPISKKDFILTFLDYIILEQGEQPALKNFRKFLPFFFSGLKNSAKIRTKLNSSLDRQEFVDSINEICL